MKRFVLGTVLAFGIAGPAFAFHCPADMAAIDAALAENPSLTSEQMAEVTELRAEGERLHQSGDHAGAVDALGQAMEILGLK